MSNFRVFRFLFLLIFLNYYGVLESIIAVVGLWPRYKGVSVVRSSKKSIRMLTCASLCINALWHIEGTSSDIPRLSYLAVYVMFWSPGLSLTKAESSVYFLIFWFTFHMPQKNTNWNRRMTAVVRLVMREARSTIDTHSECSSPSLLYRQISKIFL